MILASNGIISVSRGDTDALAFITATGITDSTQQSAINTLVTSLKSANIWTKMKAIYPFVGGSAEPHRFNLKNTSQYKIDWFGGGSHSSMGYVPNGTTSYGNTNLIPSSVLALDSSHYSYYSNTDSNAGVDFGARYESGDAGLSYMFIRDGNTSYSRLNNISGDYAVTNTNGKGMYVISREISTTFNFFKNTTKNTAVKTSSGIPIRNVTIGGVYIGAWYFGDKICSFASIGEGLSDSDVTALYNAVQTFNTTLGRQA